MEIGIQMPMVKTIGKLSSHSKILDRISKFLQTMLPMPMLPKMGKSWVLLGKIGKNWQKLAKIEKYWK